MIHVDDIMFAGRSKAVEKFVDKLKAKFEVEWRKMAKSFPSSSAPAS